MRTISPDHKSWWFGLPGVAALALVSLFLLSLLRFSVPPLPPALSVSAEEKVYHTDIKAYPRYFSVSPGGEYLVFDVAEPFGGMRLLDLGSGVIKEIPAEPDHAWEMGNWSADGKHLVAVSTGWKNRQYDRDDMKIILIDPRDWSWQVISPTGDKVKIRPFLSPDGKKVYYFRGEARTTGATAASRFDLYVIDLASLQEEKLTDERFYQVDAGDVSSDGRTIYFSKIGGSPMHLENQESRDGFIDNTLIVSLDLRTRQLQPTRDFDKAKFIDIRSPRFDANGRLYFNGITQPKWSPFVYSVYRAGRENEPAQRLADFSNSCSFDIAKRTGDIYVSDTRDGEIIFRRIGVNANQ